MAEVRKVIDWFGAKRDIGFDVSEDLVGALVVNPDSGGTVAQAYDRVAKTWLKMNGFFSAEIQVADRHDFSGQKCQSRRENASKERCCVFYRQYAENHGCYHRKERSAHEILNTQKSVDVWRFWSVRDACDPGRVKTCIVRMCGSVRFQRA